jgi:hypothetical protein
MNLVPNKELREAFLRSGLSSHVVAEFAGWFRKNGEPDTAKLLRSLGIASYNSHNGRITNKRMTEENALDVIRALNLDPVDFRDIGL